MGLPKKLLAALCGMILPTGALVLGFLFGWSGVFTLNIQPVRVRCVMNQAGTKRILPDLPLFD